MTHFRPSVSIASGKDPFRRTLDCLERLEPPRFADGARTLVKFNLAPYFQMQRTDVGTHPEVVRAAVRVLQNLGVKDIVVGEGPAGDDAMRAFEACGYRRMCEEEGVRLVDLDSEEIVEVAIPGALSLYRVGLARSVAERDVLVNVAWMRTHCYTTVSLCMKNLMGVVRPQKGIIHEPFAERITDLVMLLKPTLSIIDGTKAFDEGRNRSLVEMDVTIAGMDTVAVDAVGAAVMGFDPLKMEYIRFAQERGLGVADLNRIEVVGAQIGEVRREFVPV